MIHFRSTSAYPSSIILQTWLGASSIIGLRIKCWWLSFLRLFVGLQRVLCMVLTFDFRYPWAGSRKHHNTTSVNFSQRWSYSLYRRCLCRAFPSLLNSYLCLTAKAWDTLWLRNTSNCHACMNGDQSRCDLLCRRVYWGTNTTNHGTLTPYNAPPARIQRFTDPPHCHT